MIYVMYLFLLIFHDSVFPLTAGQLLVEQNRLIDRRLSIVGHSAIHTLSKYSAAAVQTLLKHAIKTRKLVIFDLTLKRA